MKRTIAMLSLVLSACTPALTPKAANVAQWVPPAGCKLLDTFEGSSMLNGWIFPALDRAKSEVLEAAASRGATHVQWLELDEGLLGAEAKARAYVCPTE